MKSQHFFPPALHARNVCQATSRSLWCPTSCRRTCSRMSQPTCSSRVSSICWFTPTNCSDGRSSTDGSWTQPRGKYYTPLSTILSNSVSQCLSVPTMDHNSTLEFSEQPWTDGASSSAILRRITVKVTATRKRPLRPSKNWSRKFPHPET
jgi:hypothetical protein